MTRDRFLAAVPGRLRPLLATERRQFQARNRWGLIQISYGNPRLHYEVWLQTRADLIEIGLHLESDAATNDAVLSQIARRSAEVRESLGPGFDLEVWTSTWRRVHTVLPLEPLDDRKLDACVQRLAACIEALQPIVETAARSARHRGLDERRGDDMGESLAAGRVVAATDDDPDEAATIVE
jgi:hypothetical protein